MYVTTDSVDNTEMGYGWSNTINIINGLGASPPTTASSMCRNYVNPYYDWFLPSVCEVKTLISFYRSHSLGRYQIGLWWNVQTSTQSASDTSAAYYIYWTGFVADPANTPATRSKNDFDVNVRPIHAF